MENTVSSLSVVPTFQFNEVLFDVVDRDGQPWFQSRQLAQALGYQDEDSASKIYERNADEFTGSMTATVKLTVGITPVNVRVFSLRGCHLLAMFARTPTAKAFRVWVLDILDRLTQQPQSAVPALDDPTPSTAASRKPIRDLVNAWSNISGLAHSVLWPQIRAHFQLDRMDELPEAWVPDAIAFVQGKIDAAQAQKVLPEPKKEEAPPFQSTLEIELRKQLNWNRFTVHFDDKGKMCINEMPKGAFIVTCEELPEMLNDMYFSRDTELLLRLFNKVSAKISGRMEYHLKKEKLCACLPPTWQTDRARQAPAPAASTAT